MLNVSPRTTLEIGGIFPIVYIIVFFFMLKPPQRQENGPHEDDEDALLQNDASWTPTDELVRVPEHPESGHDDDDRWPPMSEMTWVHKAKLGLSLWPYMVPLCLVYLAEYTINTGINSTLAFRSHGISSDGFYVRASFAYQVGVFFSRSSATVLPINTLWPLPTLQIINVAIFLAQALTDMMPAAWMVLFLVFWEGLLGGCVYVNGFRLIKERKRPDLREFSLGFASVADTFGIVIASLLSLWLEPTLRTYRRRHHLQG